MANIYTLKQVEILINNYIQKGGEMYELETGPLGYGLTVLSGPGLYSFVIRETALNEWASGHTIRKYKRLPTKYARMIGA